MSASSLGGRDATGQRRNVDLVPREYLRAIALWSLVPAYAVAGALLGFLADQWLDTFPFGMGVGLIVALILAVRDMIRLRDELGFGSKD
jgi:F0F1-type ATP synthase assembly protein I